MVVATVLIDRGRELRDGDVERASLQRR